VFGATDEGYGENQTALGQFVDTFSDLNNVSVAYEVVNNATLGHMQLNYTIGMSGISWWNTSWVKRQTHFIDQDPAKGQNYTVKIKVLYGNGTSSGNNMYCNETVRTDFGDVRFISSNGLELGNWIKEDEYIAGTSAKFFVRLDDLNLTTAEQSFDVYYNNSDAVATSNIHDATIFGDDFNYTGSLDPTYWNNMTYDQDASFESTSEVDGDQLVSYLQDAVDNDESDGFEYTSIQTFSGLVGWELYGEGSWANGDFLRGGGRSIHLGINDSATELTGFFFKQRGDSGNYVAILENDINTNIGSVPNSGSATWYMLMEYNVTDGTMDDWDLRGDALYQRDNEAVAGITQGIRVNIENWLDSWGGGGQTKLDVYTDYVYLIRYSDRGQNDGNWTDLTWNAGTVYSLNGYFTTIDYLSDPTVNGSTFAPPTNTPIVSNTAISIEFSSDNATWVNNLGVAGGVTLTTGFNTIELRNLNYSVGYYSRYNLSTTNNAVTPLVLQSKLISTIGNATGGGTVVSGGGVNSATIIMLIFLSVLMILLIRRFVK
jgi:hypothetical protein